LTNRRHDEQLGGGGPRFLCRPTYLNCCHLALEQILFYRAALWDATFRALDG